MTAWPVMPGVPAAGHVTARGFWHPGRPEGCVKCEEPAPRGAGERWGIDDIVDYTGLEEETIRTYRRRKQMPKEDGYQGQSPWWWDVTIRRWRGPGERLQPGRPRRG